MFRRALRLRPLMAAALSAAPFAASQPTQTYRLPQEQHHEERHVEEPPEPAFVIKIDPSFAYSLFTQLPSPPQPQHHVGVGGLGIGPSHPSSLSAPSAPPPRSRPSPPVHDEEVTHSLAKTVISTDDTPSAAPSHTLSVSPPAPKIPPTPPPTPAAEEHSSFLAPFWDAITQSTGASAPSSPPSSSSSSTSTTSHSPSSFSSASSSSSASSDSSSADAVFEHGREVGRLETYREFESFIQRTEAEKAELEAALRKVERQREEERLLALRGEVSQVEALKRRTGLKGGVCEDETKRVLMCYRQNMTEPLKCDTVVRGFALCADRAKDAVLRGK